MQFLPHLIVLAAVFVPSAIAVVLVWAQRKRFERDGRRSPIENRPVYGPGEYLRRRVEDHTDELMLSLTMLFFIGPMLIALWALERIPLAQIQFGLWDYVMIAMYAAAATTAISRIHKHAHLRRIAKAGLQAELYTAQELNRLMAMGCTVLHDVPGDHFNIDHVVIGPRAVYAVETKSVRKPRASSAKDHFKVAYDGQCLRFPDFSDSKRLQQTKRQADWLASYLRQATGQSVPVVPALALPGWWIEAVASSAYSDVRVFNPAGRGAHFMADRTPSIVDPGTTALITQALVMRYPPEETAKK